MAQFIQIASTLQKEFKERATAICKPRKPVMTAKIHATPLGDALPIEVEVEILDTVIPHALMDERSSTNKMPFSTHGS